MKPAGSETQRGMLLSSNSADTMQKSQELPAAPRSDLEVRLDALARVQQAVLEAVRRIEQTLASSGNQSEAATRVKFGSLVQQIGSEQGCESAALSPVGPAWKHRSRLDMGMTVSHNLSYQSGNLSDPGQKDWTKDVQMRSALFAAKRSQVSLSQMASWQSTDLVPTADSTAEAPASNLLILHPTSSIRLLLDSITLVALIFDIISIPFMLAWDLPVNGQWMAIGGTIATIWTVDILASFRTGFYRADMTVETQPRVILRRYLFGWFVFDLPLVLIDWFNVLAVQSAVELSWLRVAKINRLLRLIRLARVVNFSRGRRVSNVASYLDSHLTAGSRVAFNIFEILLWIVYVNHLLACMWYWIGRNASSDTGYRWIDESVASTSWHYYDAPLAFQYLTALHWSMTQMTPGSMQVFPMNSAERLFNVICLLMGFIVFGSMISTVSAQTAHLQKLRQEKAVKVERLRKYLVQKKISHSMIMHIEKDVIQRSRKPPPLLAKDVELLSQLSDKLRSSLHCETCKPFLMHHPILRCALSPYPTLLLTVCSGSSLEFRVFAPGDIVFDVSSQATFAYRIVQGTVKYRSLRASINALEDFQHAAGTWFAEAALWLEWTYLGTAEVSSACEMLAVNAPSLLECMNEVPLARRLLRAYAKMYQGFMIASPPAEVAHIDDITSSNWERMEVFIGYLPKEIQTSIGQACLSALKDKWSWVMKQRQLQKMAFEVESGHSILFFREDGGVQRMIRIAVLRLFRRDGRLLAKVGSWKDGSVVPECSLPEKAVRCEEHPKDAVMRLLDEQLTDLAAEVCLTEVEFETETTKGHDEFRKHGLVTKRLKSIHVARLAGLAIVSGSTSEVSSSTAVESVAISQLPKDILVYSDGSNVSVYAWMRASEFKWLSRPDAYETLSRWLSEVKGTERLEQMVQSAIVAAARSQEPLSI